VRGAQVSPSSGSGILTIHRHSTRGCADLVSRTSPLPGVLSVLEDDSRSEPGPVRGLVPGGLLVERTTISGFQSWHASFPTGHSVNAHGVRTGRSIAQSRYGIYSKIACSLLRGVSFDKIRGGKVSIHSIRVATKNCKTPKNQKKKKKNK